MRPRKRIGAPRVARNMGSRGKIASEETSLRRLANPSSQITRGSLRTLASAARKLPVRRVRRRGGWSATVGSGSRLTFRFLQSSAGHAEFYIGGTWAFALSFSDAAQVSHLPARAPRRGAYRFVPAFLLRPVPDGRPRRVARRRLPHRRARSARKTSTRDPTPKATARTRKRQRNERRRLRRAPGFDGAPAPRTTFGSWSVPFTRIARRPRTRNRAKAGPGTCR